MAGAGGHVVVIGGGTAGLPAAIFAAGAGARVTILEKAPQLGGTLWYSTASISAAGTSFQREKGIEDDPETHYREILATGRGRNNHVLVRRSVQSCPRAIEWLRSIGVPFTEATPRLAPEHEPYSVPRTHDPLGYPHLTHIPGGGAGIRVLEAFQREIDSRVSRGQIVVEYRARVTRLVTAGNRLRAVRFQRGGSEHALDCDAAILTSGGYASNPDLLRRFHPRYSRLVSVCPPTATGDGLGLVEDLGGELVNTDLVVPLPGGFPEARNPNNCIYLAYAPMVRPPGRSGDIWVNRLGQRFVNEAESTPDQRERAAMDQPGGEIYLIFDEPMRRGLEPDLARRMAPVEAQLPPIITSDPTLEGLARRLGLPPATLAATVARYNAAVAAGRDADFERRAMPRAIDTPPYHGVCTYGVLFGTAAGIRVDNDLRVVGRQEAIENLFAAGEVLGQAQIMGDGVAGGQAVGPAIAFGMEVGEAAARLAASFRGRAVAR